MKALILVVFLLFSVAPVLAQHASAVQGVSVQADVNSASWIFDDASGDPESGAGFGLGILYGFNSHLAMTVRFDFTALEESSTVQYGMGHFDLGLTYFCSTDQSKIRPYAGLIYSGFATIEETDPKTEMSGAGLGGIVGLNYFISPKIALNAGIAVNKIRMQERKIGSTVEDLDGEKATSSRVLIGLKVAI